MSPRYFALTAVLASLAACAPASETETETPALDAEQPETETMSDDQARLEAENAQMRQYIQAAEQHIVQQAQALERANGLIADIARRCDVAEDLTVPAGEFPAEHSLDTYRAASEVYLDVMRTQACVFELPSGLLFRIRQSSDGESPVSGENVTVHYRGTLPQGGEFDSSYSRGAPATFPSDRLIAGWVEALPLMRVGERWEIFIASDLAYGDRGAGADIRGGQALNFELELIALPDRPAADTSEDSESAE